MPQHNFSLQFLSIESSLIAFFLYIIGGKPLLLWFAKLYLRRIKTMVGALGHCVVQNRPRSWISYCQIDPVNFGHSTVLFATVVLLLLVSDSAWWFLQLKPKDCSCFISESRVAMLFPWKHQCQDPACHNNVMCLNKPQQRWCRVFAGYSEPSFFLTLSMKLLNHDWRWSGLLTISSGT